MPNTYDIGSMVRLSVSFKDISGALVDPTEVQLNIRPYGGDIQSFLYSDDQIIKQGTGLYYYDYTPDQPALYYYRFIGTGAVVAAGDGQFSITESPATGAWPSPPAC